MLSLLTKWRRRISAIISINNTPDSPAKPPDDRTDQGGNYWTLFAPGIWKALHAVLRLLFAGARGPEHANRSVSLSSQRGHRCRRDGGRRPQNGQIREAGLAEPFISKSRWPCLIVDTRSPPPRHSRSGVVNRVGLPLPTQPRGGNVHSATDGPRVPDVAAWRHPAVK
jgi:hypothetical protein